jgi:hypothetical protein
MAITLKHVQNNVAGAVPDKTDLALGELAVNTADGAVFFKKITDASQPVSAANTHIVFLRIPGGVSDGGVVIDPNYGGSMQADNVVLGDTFDSGYTYSWYT